MSFESQGFNTLADAAHLFFGGVRLHDNQHARVSRSFGETIVYGMEKKAANGPEF
jgi:hypothetical protein